MAVKRIRSTVDEREQKELLMDLDVVMRSNECPAIVMFFGAIFKEGDCWICMELMSTSTDKFYRFIYHNLKESIPEKVQAHCDDRKLSGHVTFHVHILGDRQNYSGDGEGVELPQGKAEDNTP